MNILTFDLEDWYQLIHRRVTGELPPARDTLIRQTDVLLELLEQQQARATFFVLGVVAERFPELVRRIAGQGHEIGSHGYAHLRVHELSRQQFEDDTRRARDLLEDLVGKTIRGYRAPEFSIHAGTLWALDILAACGFTYDSSIFPIHHRRYGLPGFHPSPSTYQLPSGLRIAELPVATLSIAGLRVAVAGGSYFRLWPLWMVRRAVQWHEAHRLPMTTYFHPYEFDAARLDLFETVPPDGWKRRITGSWVNCRYNLGRAGVRAKLAAVLQQSRFTTCQEYLDAYGCGEDRGLLRPASAAV